MAEILDDCGNFIAQGYYSTLEITRRGRSLGKHMLQDAVSLPFRYRKIAARILKGYSGMLPAMQSF